MKIQVSELIVRYLQRLGIDTIFGMPGAHILPVYDDLYDSPIKSVLVKHEQGAAFMAGGYARISGGIGACIATAGPGATNLVTGIANAYADKQPVIAITGEAPTHIFGKGGLQESSGESGSVNLPALFSGVTNYYKMIERTDYLGNVLNQASKHLLADIAGPVVLSIPYNVQKEMVDEEILDQVACQRQEYPLLVASEYIEHSIELIDQAKKPVIVAGFGCLQSAAQAQLSALSERLNIPVTSSLKAKGAIDENSALSLGSLGVTSAGYALEYIQQQADLLILLGASFNERTSYVWNQGLTSAKKIIQVDQNPHQLEKVYQADLAIRADIMVYLALLNEALDISGIVEKDCEDIPAFKQRLEAEAEQNGTAIFNHQFDVVRAFYEQLQLQFEEGIILFDDNIIFAQNFYKARTQDRFFPNTGASSLGHAIPAAIGARFKTDKPVFALIGDGGFQMCCMEIMTAVNYNIPINIVLFNNASMGLIRKNQHQLYQQRFIDCDFDNPDYAELAKSFGIEHMLVKSADECADVFSALDLRKKINLIEIVLDQDAYPNYSSKR
jgi:acetolactate synthase-1/2/3 large subunit